MTEYRYRYLPSGNAPEFAYLDAELVRRGVRAEVSEIGDSRIWRIPVEDLPKLPFDKDGPWLGDDYSGYSLSENALVWESLRAESGTDWRPIRSMANLYYIGGTHPDDITYDLSLHVSAESPADAFVAWELYYWPEIDDECPFDITNLLHGRAESSKISSMNIWRVKHDPFWSGALSWDDQNMMEHLGHIIEA